jgi:hypothetical protein
LCESDVLRKTSCMDAVKDVEEGGGEEEEVEGVRGGVEGEEAEDISQD